MFYTIKHNDQLCLCPFFIASFDLIEVMMEFVLTFHIISSRVTFIFCFHWKFIFDEYFITVCIIGVRSSGEGRHSNCYDATLKMSWCISDAWTCVFSTRNLYSSTSFSIKISTFRPRLFWILFLNCSLKLIFRIHGEAR